MTEDAFTERQRAHAQTFQTQLQALYSSLAGPEEAIACMLAKTLADLEQLQTVLTDPVSQGKVLAALHILRSVATDVWQEGRR